MFTRRGVSSSPSLENTDLGQRAKVLPPDPCPLTGRTASSSVDTSQTQRRNMRRRRRGGVLETYIHTSVCVHRLWDLDLISPSRGLLALFPPSPSKRHPPPPREGNNTCPQPPGAQRLVGGGGRKPPAAPAPPQLSLSWSCLTQSVLGGSASVKSG